jgi:hypothetical protein
LPLSSLQGDTGDDPIFPLPPHPGSRVPDWAGVGELQVMVAKENPKAMAGIDGTGRTPTIIPRYVRPKSHRMSTPNA